MNKILIFLFLSFSIVTFAQTQEPKVKPEQPKPAQLEKFYKSTDVFLKKVVYQGRVDYSLVSKNKTELNRIISRLKTFPAKELSTTGIKKMFWLNVYNLSVIHFINKYKIKESVQEIPGFYDTLFVNVGGNPYSLNAIEQIAFKLDLDTKLYFCFVQGAMSSPYLADSSYRHYEYDDMIYPHIDRIINNTEFIDMDEPKGKYKISEYFYMLKPAIDTQNVPVLFWVNAFRRAEINSDFEETVVPFNWKLNSTKKPK